MISVLYARADSVYKTLPDVDVWDADRDARKWPGGNPAVCHPPCAQWGTLRHMATKNQEVKDLAFHAVEAVQKYGGVIEHPARSQLWKEANLPEPGHRPDKFGGWTIVVPQFWFGHAGYKGTRLYICGLQPAELPEIPLVLGEPARRVANQSKAQREHTPPDFARWLVEVAKRIQKKGFTVPV